MTTMIELKNVSKQYKEVKAVDRLNLKIKKGEIFGLLGPNGAGKSTTIHMLLGLTEPTEGEVYVGGIHATTRPIEVKKRVGFLPDDVGFYEDMTGLENLLLTARLNGLKEDMAKERALSLLKQVGLEDAANKKAGEYSRGMRQRLGLADVLMKDPEVVILDEPTLGIDPKGIQEFLKMIRTLSKEKKLTVLLSSHQLHQVQQICDRVGLFVKGKLLAQGDMESLQKQLFDDYSVQYKVEIGTTSQNPEEELNKIPGVQSVVPQSDGTYIIDLKQADNGELARFIIEKGYRLFSLEKVSYGLNEIYQRYFQGGETLGSS
ncbi:ABC-2 type transport system ATP-binding protein [Melghiribacillus thermohalophilus]|uniref:ABC-2 type transport system ATP-binding protein n=2 Tax=Melghiribacillus thermohalophilus TaxID=1324956 RepID=A0A4R3N4H6_9BACI|nr:ABC-2 type transport system ATP-binding protein [Melghiribacillus thermohalophilus]